jgi:DNA-binding IclR family transcriptional regulator
MDVTKAARAEQTRDVKAKEGDPGSTAQAAKVLAAIHAGTEVAADLPEKSGLDDADVLAALSWLSKSGLIELEHQNGALHARLTEPAKAALDST